MGWLGGNSKDYQFHMFSASHAAVLAILVLGSLILYFNRGKLNMVKWRKAEVGIAISLIVMELAYHIWLAVHGIWYVSDSIPVELCSISLILSILLLLTRKKFIYEILLFTGLLGASQALLTPVLFYDFPHFRFFHFFYTHLMMIWVPLYFTWIKGYRPTIWSVVKMFVFLNVLLPIIMFINNLVDGNYMFLARKPSTASLLDVLGPYPYYILSMEGLLIILSLIVWLLFREKTGRKKSNHSDLSFRK